MKDRKKAFTLAEVLITIGIIGIVAAITIPSLLFKYNEKQTVTKLKGLQSTLARTMKLAENENENFGSWVEPESTEKEAAEKIFSVIKNYLKIAVDCGTNDEELKCVAPAGSYRHKNGNIGTYPNPDNENFYKFTLYDGTTVFLTYKSEDALSFICDTNGKKKPNTLGKDIFEFYYFAKDGIIPGGVQKINPYEEECLPKTSSGWGCAYYVLKFGKMDYLK